MTDLIKRSLGPEDIRLRIGYCGICGTDIHEYLGGPIFPPQKGSTNAQTGISLPVTLGHEFSGTITEVGSSVTGNNLTIGQQVTINPSVDDRHLNLPSCMQCQLGKQNICAHWCCHGLSAEGGGLSEEIVVRAIAAVPLPSNVSLQQGALIEPLAVANHMITLSGITQPQHQAASGKATALILGAGPIGLALLLLLRARGVSWIGVSEPSAARRAKAQSFRADAIFDPTSTDVVSTLLSTGPTKTIGVDVAFETTGLQITLDTAIAATRAGGTIFNVAIHEKALSINPNDLFFLEKRYLGGMCYTTKDFEEVLGLMQEGKLKGAKEMITKVVKLDDAVEGAFMELVRNRDEQVKILVEP